MTKVKQAEAHTTQGEQTTHEKTEYHEVGAHEVEEMLRKVEEGGDEEKLREQLIKNSKW